MGDSIRLTCTSYRSSPPPVMTWSIKEYEYPMPDKQTNDAIKHKSLLQIEKDKFERKSKARNSVKSEVNSKHREDKAGKYNRASQHYLNAKHEGNKFRHTRPSIIPFTYSTKFNKTKSYSDHSIKERPVNENYISDEYQSDFHFESRSLPKSFHKHQNIKNFYSYSFRKLSSFHVTKKYRDYHDNFTVYSKRNSFGWKEVRMSSTPSVKKQAVLKNEAFINNKFLTDTASSTFPSAAYFPSKSNYLTTLQELTLPPRYLEEIGSTSTTKTRVYNSKLDQVVTPKVSRDVTDSSSVKDFTNNIQHTRRKEVGTMQYYTPTDNGRKTFRQVSFIYHINILFYGRKY